MTRSLNGRQRALRRYHELTNHSPAGVASSGDEVGIGCPVSDLTYSIVLDAVGGDAGSLAPRTVDAP